MGTFQGISFPFRKGSTGFPEPAPDDNALIKDSLIQLILTGTGERVMRPAFGTNARQFLFEPNDDVLAALIQTELSSVITRYEPRVRLDEVFVLRQDSNVVITIAYTVLSTQTPDTVGVRL